MKQSKRELKRKLMECLVGGLSMKYFQAGEIDSLDDMSQYVRFLDSVTTREELVEGLRELSPFADDALAAAERMTPEEFSDFKMRLSLERKGEDSEMPLAFTPILLPDRFLPAISLAQKAAAPLGTTLVRLLEHELGISLRS